MTVNREPEKTTVTFHCPMVCISSAIFGGGLKKNVTTIANVTIPHDLNVSVNLMPDYCQGVIRQSGRSAWAAVVLLTAVPQTYIGQSSDKRCLVTTGLNNACPLIPDQIWDEKSGKTLAYSPGTINCIMVLADSLSPSALVEGYGLAKLAIAEVVSDWCHKQGVPVCVGTRTDCTALLCPQVRSRLKFAGLGTKIGTYIVQTVKEATVNALKHKYPAFTVR